ncbi:MAG: hypothetical protein AAGA71_14785 [Pseudomonadota bacterium]
MSKFLNAIFPECRDLRIGWYVVLCALLFAFVGLTAWQEKWISDDGYIYIAYVANYFHIGELTFNPGDTVDAATGFLWLLLLVAAEYLSPFAMIEQTTIALSVAFSLMAVIVMVSGRVGSATLAAAAILFVPYFMRSFATSGLETPLIVFFLICLHYDRSWGRRAAILGALPFVRPELALVTAIYLPVVAAGHRWGVLLIMSVVGLGLAGFRFFLFGDVLPNTAFAKLGLDTYENGSDYAVEFLRSYPHVLILLVVLVTGAVALGKIRGFQGPIPARIVPPTVGAGLLACYTVLSGGDFMHGRFFLPAYVLTVVAVSELCHAIYEHPKRPQTSGAVIAFCLVAAIPAGLAGSSLAGNQPYNWWKGIMDESAAYGANNPAQHQWARENEHPWAQEGRALADLSRRIERPVGVARTGIGQVRTFSITGDVYVFDLLSLTQVTGTFIDQMGRWDRPGHGAGIPFEIVYGANRVTLFEPPDPALAELLTFKFQGHTYVLGALDELGVYASKGLLPPTTEARVHERIEAMLTQDVIDTRALLYFHHRYPPDGPLRDGIDTMFRTLAERAHTYPAWYTSVEALIKRGDEITRGQARSLPTRYATLIRAGDTRPIKRRYAFRQHVSISQEDCRIPLSDWDISGATANTDGKGDTLVISEPGATLSLDKSKVVARCGASRQRLQLLVQPLFGDPSPAKGYRIGEAEEELPFYGGRVDAPRTVEIPLATIEDSIVLRPSLDAGQSIGIELVSYAD